MTPPAGGQRGQSVACVGFQLGAGLLVALDRSAHPGQLVPGEREGLGAAALAVEQCRALVRCAVGAVTGLLTAAAAEGAQRAVQHRWLVPASEVGHRNPLPVVCNTYRQGDRDPHPKPRRLAGTGLQTVHYRAATGVTPEEPHPLSFVMNKLWTFAAVRGLPRDETGPTQLVRTH